MSWYHSNVEVEQNKKLKGNKFIIDEQGYIVININGKEMQFESVDSLCYYVKEYYKIVDALKSIKNMFNLYF